MSSIFQAIQLPLGGTVMSLENCTVQAKYPAKMAKNNKPFRNIMLSDSSGSIAVSLWGPAAELGLYDGSVVTLRGTFKRAEYNGAPQLSGENGISIEGGAAQPSLPVAGGASPTQSAPSGGSYHQPSDKDASICRQSSLTRATELVIAAGGVKDVFTAQQLILDLAKVYTHFALTGEAKQVEDSQQEYGEPDSIPF